MLLMQARLWTYRIMAMGPVILLGAIALNGRAGSPPDDRPVFGLENQRRLCAYVKPIRSTESLGRAVGNADSETLDAAVQIWMTDYEAGKLESVLPVDFETPIQDTVIGEISDAKSALIFGLLNRLRGEASIKDPNQRSNALVQVVQIAAINKYSDFGSVHIFADYQAQCLQEIRKLAPALDDAHRLKVYDAVKKVQEQEIGLRVLVSKVRDLHCAALARQGRTALSIELSQGYGQLSQVVLTRSEEATSKLRAISLQPSMPIELLNISALARIALKSEDDYHRELQQATDLLQSVK